jgi:hypothetical protein
VVSAGPRVIANTLWEQERRATEWTTVLRESGRVASWAPVLPQSQEVPSSCSCLSSFYAFILAFRARGFPDQSAINHFAAMFSPASMPWLERVLTPVLAFWVVRRTEQARAVDGLAVGLLAGLLGLGVTPAFGGSLDARSMVFFLILVGLGWLGGLVGKKMSSRS